MLKILNSKLYEAVTGYSIVVEFTDFLLHHAIKLDQWCFKQEAHQLVGQAKHRATKSSRRLHFRPFFSNFDKCWTEVAGDAISPVAVDLVGMDVHVKFGDSTLNSPTKNTSKVCWNA